MVWMKRTVEDSGPVGNNMAAASLSPLRRLSRQLVSIELALQPASVKEFRHRKSDICWLNPPDFPLSLFYFASIRGAENFHLYIWVLKDLSWTQCWYTAGHIFGSLAVIWSAYILFHAVHDRNANEIFTGVAQFFWLLANTWWMTGELHDHQYPNQDKWYDSRVTDAGIVMKTALVWLGCFYLIVKPFKLFPLSEESEKKYDSTGLKSRFPHIFRTWREYENLHMLFWLGKDCAWNALIGPMWIVFLIPTVIIAADFVYVSFFVDYMIVDHAHYVAQFMWVIANLVWAAGEIYDPEYDKPYQLYDSNPTSRRTLRWASGWILVCAFIPLAAMFAAWIYSTVMGITRLDQSRVVRAASADAAAQYAAQMDQYPRLGEMTASRVKKSLLEAAEGVLKHTPLAVHEEHAEEHAEDILYGAYPLPVVVNEIHMHSSPIQSLDRQQQQCSRQSQNYSSQDQQQEEPNNSRGKDIPGVIGMTSNYYPPPTLPPAVMDLEAGPGALRTNDINSYSTASTPVDDTQRAIANSPNSVADRFSFQL